MIKKSCLLFLLYNKVRKEVLKMGRPRGGKNRKWTVEEKLRIVKRYLDDHVGISALEKEEGAANSLILSWVEKYNAQGEEGLINKTGNRGNPYAALHTSKSLTEEERLKLIILKQQIEIERLKKGYWVEGDGLSTEFVTSNDVNTKSSKP